MSYLSSFNWRRVIALVMGLGVIALVWLVGASKGDGPLPVHFVAQLGAWSILLSAGYFLYGLIPSITLGSHLWLRYLCVGFLALSLLFGAIVMAAGHWVAAGIGIALVLVSLVLIGSAPKANSDALPQAEERVISEAQPGSQQDAAR